MKTPDFEDLGGLREWLDALPQDVQQDWSVFIASRAAARMAPLEWRWQTRGLYLDPSPGVRDFWRALVTSRVARLRPNRSVSLDFR